jgi:aldehyde dehydrogenase (NAD+)
VTAAAKIRAGQVSINGYGICLTEAFGGFKQSGLGREGGAEGIACYLETQLMNYSPTVTLAG